jgi:hypothetical protein
MALAVMEAYFSMEMPLAGKLFLLRVAKLTNFAE